MFTIRTGCLLLLFSSSSLLQAVDTRSSTLKKRNVQGKQTTSFDPLTSPYFEPTIKQLEKYDHPDFLSSFRHQYLSDEDTRLLVRSIPLQVSVNLLSLFAGANLDPSVVSSVIHAYGSAAAALRIPHRTTSIYKFYTQSEVEELSIPEKIFYGTGSFLHAITIPSRTHWNAAKTIGKHWLIYYNLPLGAVAQLVDMYFNYAISEADGTPLAKLNMLNVAEFLENRDLYKIYSDTAEYHERKMVLNYIINEKRAEYLGEENHTKTM